MKAPEKKPLVRREAPDEVKAKVRKGERNIFEEKYSVIKIFQLLEFH